MDEKKTKRVCEKCGYEFEDEADKPGQPCQCGQSGQSGKPENVVCPGCGDIVDEDMFIDDKADH